VVHFRIVKSGVGNLVAQSLTIANRAQAQDHTLESLVEGLQGDSSDNVVSIEDRRTLTCKTLGDLARDDQQKAIKKFLSNRRLLNLLAQCAKSSNEALQFEALRVWWNFSFNDSSVQALAMEHLGATLLSSLLNSPNESLRLRAIGLIWNVTQNDSNSRIVLTEAGAVGRLSHLLSIALREVTSSRSPPWGLVQLICGALANLAVSCSSQLRRDRALVRSGELLVWMDCPDVVQQQALRLVCNLISGGEVDEQWRKCGYSSRSSAPREGTSGLA
jgi:hypothetical protein